MIKVFKIFLLGLLLGLFLPLSGVNGQNTDWHQYKDTIRVACVGNSVTYGYKIPNREENCYPAQLQELLGNRFEVVNFGYSGATLLKKGHKPYWEKDVFQKALDFKPHVVIIHLGLNDTDPRNWPNYRDEFLKDYYALIDTFVNLPVNPAPKIWICGMTPIFSWHSRFVAGTRDWYWQIQEAIDFVAQHRKVGFIDLYTPLHDRPDQFKDALHPGAEGAGIMAKQIYGSLTGKWGGLHMPEMFSDGMVLQRHKPIPVWGTANSGEKVEVTFDGTTQTAMTNAEGKWKVEFSAHKAGGPFQIKVKAPSGEQLFKDVLVGEVWLCSGQSNMAFELINSKGGKEEAANANNPQIRLFNMKAIAWADGSKWDSVTLEKVNRGEFYKMGPWQKVTPESSKGFSAIAYYFGKKLYEELQVPIGLIHNSKGGSPTESWIDRKTLEFHPHLVSILNNWKKNPMIQDWVRQRAALNSSKSSNPFQRHPFEPAYLYEAGIAPLTTFPIQGAIWYQGESNANNVELHEELFTTLVESWRNAWGYDFPFYYVQLSSLNRPSWPHFRDSQRRMLDQIPNSGMAVCSDIGNPKNVHPIQKSQVGDRLAYWALAQAYDKNIEYSGPLFEKAFYHGNEVEITFSHAKGLHAPKGEDLKGFELAGEDGIFYPAQAHTKGKKVLVTSSKVAKPQYVRYGWKAYSEGNLYNQAELPASTFTSDFIIF